jgi:cell division transport system permease protein
MSPEVSTRPHPDVGVAPRRPRHRAASAGAIVADAVAGLRRNALMAAAATTTIAIALTVAGGGFLLSANLGHLAAILESQVEVVGFIRRDLPLPAQQRIVSEIEAMPGVRSARVVDRGESLRRLQRTYRALAAAGELLSNNPLPDSIEVQVADAQRVRDVAAALRGISGVTEVVFGAPVVDRLVALTRAVRVAGVLITTLLVASALLIIINTIRLTVAARRQEIEIMTLVGATPGFIRGPFILEGALQGLAAAVVASLLVAGAYAWLWAQVSRSLPFLPLLPPGAIVPAAALVWGLGVGVGVAGSEIGIRRHLRV